LEGPIKKSFIKERIAPLKILKASEVSSRCPLVLGLFPEIQEDEDASVG
jgi:hypothetical protein